jgi:hypothetical protein
MAAGIHALEWAPPRITGWPGPSDSPVTVGVGRLYRPNITHKRINASSQVRQIGYKQGLSAVEDSIY